MFRFLQNVPTGRYVLKRTILCNRPLFRCPKILRLNSEAIFSPHGDDARISAMFIQCPFDEMTQF